MSSETISANIQVWRQKAREGTLTTDEMRQAIAAIRKERVGASAVSAASTARKTAAKAAKAPVDSEALLSELGL